MAQQSAWAVDEARTLDFDGRPVDELHVRLVNGTVNVVGTDAPAAAGEAGGAPAARVEITEVHGAPVTVRYQDGRLTVGYDDLPWQGFLKWLDGKGWERSAVVSVSVPASVRLTVGVVGASAMVSGISGRTEVRGVTGGTTLVGLTGPARADTVSGDVEAQGLGGELRFGSVSGGLTVIDGRSPSVRADSMSGTMMLDLAPSDTPADLRLSTVSGEVAVRLPDPADAVVSAGTAGGTVSSAFDELTATGQWAGKKLGGTLGAGRGRVQVTTVSGSVAVLRRPPGPDEAPAATTLRKDA
ncbi:DUF4097 family beta strand repeat-containing protein [Streptomyces sodiiphilus]|uniref:DUF4097 family beta strand repeat-containing protein n=1 Tax=Streptomyces sodiiphilus TaxID=226217 RepID=A0ABN2NUT3_9ACTN